MFLDLQFLDLPEQEMSSFQDSLVEGGKRQPEGLSTILLSLLTVDCLQTAKAERGPRT